MNHHVRTLLLAILFFLPAVAFAHTPIKGLDNFYNGVLHPFFVPAHILAILAVGLLFGRQGSDNIPALIMGFIAATVLGLGASGFSISIDLSAVLVVETALIGLLIAADFKLPLQWCLIIGAVVGVIIGLDSSQPDMTGKAKLITLFGSGVGVYLMILYPMGFADYFNKKPWQLIGVRVLGSWLAASAFMVLALLFVPKH